MITFAIFWVVLFAVLFFALGLLFKGLASAIIAFLEAFGSTISVGVLTCFACGTLYLIYLVVDSIISDGLGMAIFMVVILFLTIGLIFGLIGGLGEWLVGAAIVVAQVLINVTSIVFEGAAALCQKVFLKLMTWLKTYLGKC